MEVEKSKLLATLTTGKAKKNPKKTKNISHQLQIKKHLSAGQWVQTAASSL